VRQVDYLKRLYRDARLTEHKILFFRCLFAGQVFRIVINKHKCPRLYCSLANIASEHYDLKLQANTAPEFYDLKLQLQHC
jgi:hypothetical protein